ncbi:MAG: ABC transporter permease, partial [Dehalococcoidia bacterium]
MKFFRDVRFALRTLRKAPSFTLTTALLIAVGVGAVTTIFTLVDHVLLRPLPYPEAERLVTLDNGSHSGPLFQRLRQSQTVESWAGARVANVSLTGVGDPLRLDEARVTRDFFGLFGARADHGRLLLEQDFDAADAVVLDGGAWRRIWGADPAVVGRTIQIDGNPVVVVGVLDAAFSPPEAVLGSTVDLWRPADWSWESLNSHEYKVLEVAGRLVDGSTVEAVQSEMDAIITVLAGEHRNYQRDDGSPSFTPVVPLADATVRGVRTGLGLLMGAVGLLLLIACANVAHLFLARGLGRTREMAVRRALGAGTSTLTGQLLAESLVVGLAGGAGGAALAALGLRSFMALNPSALPRQEAVG